MDLSGKEKSVLLQKRKAYHAHHFPSKEQGAHAPKTYRHFSHRRGYRSNLD